MTLRQRRLKKGWTQLQLAEFSGLSLRTIQRIEKGHPPTIESLKALAAVFEVDFNDLVGSDDYSPIDESRLSSEEVAELEHVKGVQNFIKDFLAFVITVPFLILFWWLNSHGTNWGLWAALGWGSYLAWEAFDVFDAKDFLGRGWDKRMLERRLGRKVQ